MKPCFVVRNADSDHASIDIFGDIGESWWTESYTMQDAKRDLEGISAKKITLNISSLGGDLNDALVIHDMLKMHPAEVTSKIVGATASSGTVVALGADKDKVEMSDNALFLVHNASTFGWGNAEEFRSIAGDLDVWDDRLVNLYHKQTGKADKEIRDLMGEEKWISAEEAETFGFVTDIFNGPVIEAKVRDSVNNASKLIRNIPRIENNENPTIMKEVLDAIKAEFKIFKDIIKADIDSLKPGEGEENTPENKAAIEALETKLDNASTDFETKIKDLKPAEPTADMKVVTDELEKIKDENARLKAGETIVEDVKKDDPNPAGDVKKNGWEKLTDQMMSVMPSTMQDRQPSKLAELRKAANA